MSQVNELVEEALELHRQGQIEEAAKRYEATLAQQPDRFEAWHMLGVVRLQQQRVDEAIALIQTALKLRPESFDALCDFAYARMLVGRFDDAIACYGRALSIRSNRPDAWIARGTTLLAAGRVADAIGDFEQALLLDPASHEAMFKLGQALIKEQRFEEALANFDSLLAALPDHAPAWNERGIALWSLNRHDAAIASYDSAIGCDPRLPEPFYNRGNAWLALNQNQRAVEDFDRALALAPSYAEAHRSRGHALTNLKRLEEAAESYSKAVACNSTLQYAMGYAVQAKAQVCDWTDYGANVSQLTDAARNGDPACVPFTLLCFADDPEAHLACAKAFVGENLRAVEASDPKPRERRHDRIRLAYLSADYHEHATAYLIAELLELHDRSRFEIIAISFGPDDNGPMRQRLRAATDRFIGVRAFSDGQVADLIRDLEIDIAIDLKGHTLGARPAILAPRPAPIQASFLGYPGTMGATFIDYIIADRIVIPPGDERYYVESVVRLPDSYQVNDSKRSIAARTPTRAELGLPAEVFVFCCFNAAFKITPAMFDVWMRLLRRIDGSILWLLRGAALAEENLRREASHRGIDPQRLVFAPFAPLNEHLARHRAADLFLDTVPCNAHTTASDALWANLPVLTCEGRSFASRVASSLLHALQLPELVTKTLAEYEDRATQLSTDPVRLEAIRQKLRQARDNGPLFDPERFRRNLEAAYGTMWQRFREGKPPVAFDVEPHHAYVMRS